eukprot:363662-Chlamydomonas_euryale.AAC.20
MGSKTTPVATFCASARASVLSRAFPTRIGLRRCNARMAARGGKSGRVRGGHSLSILPGPIHKVNKAGSGEDDARGRGSGRDESAGVRPCMHASQANASHRGRCGVEPRRVAGPGGEPRRRCEASAGGDRLSTCHLHVFRGDHLGAAAVVCTGARVFTVRFWRQIIV